MGMVHDLLEAKGKQLTLLTDLDRSEVEAAAAYMADEENDIAFLYSGWCQAALPHRRLPDTARWEIANERASLFVHPGQRSDPNGGPSVPVGVPYGSRARLILIYLQSEALKTGDRTVHLGRSMTNWLHRMGISDGGKSLHAVRDQAERLSWCHLTFQRWGGERMEMRNQSIVESALLLRTVDGAFFVETARLSEGFFNQLQEHPVPLEEAAIRAINNNSMALDIYAWLVYRLHSLKVGTPRPITWTALKQQFGNGFSRMDHFRATFCDNLRLALAVYRDARVEVDLGRGLTLYHSRPPVLPRSSSGKVRAIG